MTTTSINAACFGRASYPINWNLNADEFDYDEATKYYHDKITYHFDSICNEQGSTGSIFLSISEVYSDVDDDSDVDYFEIIKDAVSLAYDDLCTMSESGAFDFSLDKK